MNEIVDVQLAGQAEPLRMEAEAFDSLRTYLDEAQRRLHDNPDADEVVTDLERAIGQRLAEAVTPGGSVLGTAAVADVLGAVGEVDEQPAMSRPGRDDTLIGGRQSRRRLYRIREGQWLGGVCTGVAAYADVGVDWVRTSAVLLTLVTAGLFVLLYLALVLLLPVVPTRAAWVNAMHDQDA
jgi:phage shock protein C